MYIIQRTLAFVITYFFRRFEGKVVQEGTYTYSIEIIGEDKRAFSKTGTINVIY